MRLRDRLDRRQHVAPLVEHLQVHLVEAVAKLDLVGVVLVALLHHV